MPSKEDDNSQFAFAATHLPAAACGETLYSWCGRYHRLSGCTTPTWTSKILFGQQAIGLRHDFPAGLEFFHNATHGALGSIEEVLHTRTAFGFYAPFLSGATRERIRAILMGQSRQSPRKLLGLPRSGMTIPNSLKACPDCLGDQLREQPYAYWTIDRQWPTVGVCTKHNRALRVLRHDRLLPEVRDWYLPHEISEADWLLAAPLSEGALYLAQELARWTELLVSQANLQFDECLLRLAYRLQAKERGWVAMNGSVRLRALRDAFETEHREIVSLPGLAFLADIDGPNAGFLGLVLREYPGSRHPAKHIALIRFLFREPEIFFSAYNELTRARDLGALSGLSARLKSTQQELGVLVGKMNQSVAGASKTLGIPPTQAIRFLRKVGIVYERRPRILDHAKRSKLLELLSAGAERSEIATALGIRRAFIKDYLGQNQELRLAWETARQSRRLEQYRSHFLAVLNENSGVPIKRIRRVPGSGFQWLYRNDREWLEEHLPGIWHRAESL